MRLSTVMPQVICFPTALAEAHGSVCQLLHRPLGIHSNLKLLLLILTGTPFAIHISQERDRSLVLSLTKNISG